MSVETHRVLIGACGWKHPDWLDGFYDEDLPHEWQLGFYSNEFPVIYLKPEDWLSEEDLELSEWGDEVSETFCFILEIPPHVLTSKQQFAIALDKVRQLGEFCQGLVMQLNPEVINDVQSFQTSLIAAKEVAAVAVDSGEVSLSAEIKQVLDDEAISEVWKGKLEESEKLKGGPLAVARVNSSELEPAELRKLIEVSLAASSENCISVLCFDGEPPSLEVMRNANIILNLL